MLVILALMVHWLTTPADKAMLSGGNLGSDAKLAPQTTLVVAGLVGSQVVNDRLNAIGTGRALSSVALMPWSDGTLEQLFVESGAKVMKGDAIAKLDSEKEEISLEKAKTSLNDASLALDRIETLRASNTVSAVQEINAKLTLKNAELTLRDAQLALDRRTVRSPISGIVGILPVDAGNYVTTNTALAHIDDRSKILIDIWIPERFAPFVKIGAAVYASSVARPGESFTGKIQAIDNTIDEQSRTLRVRAELDNAEDTLRAGMSFNVLLKFKGDSYGAIDPLAIQWASEGSYVWKIENNSVSRVAVTIVQRNTDTVLVEGNLKINDYVVVKGLQSLREHSVVTVQNLAALRRLQQSKSQLAPVE